MGKLISLFYTAASIVLPIIGILYYNSLYGSRLYLRVLRIAILEIAEKPTATLFVHIEPPDINLPWHNESTASQY